MSINQQQNNNITEQNFDKLKQENQIQLEIIKAKISTLDHFLSAQKEQVANLDSKIKKVQQSLQIEGSIRQTRMNNLELKKQKYQEVIDLLMENLTLAKQDQNLLLEQKSNLNKNEAKVNLKKKIKIINQQILSLESKKNYLYLLKSDQQDASKANIQSLLSHQEILLFQYQINLLNIKKKNLKADYALIENKNTKTYQYVVDHYRKTLDQIAFMKVALKELNTQLNDEAILIKMQNKRNWFILRTNASSIIKETEQVQLQMRERLRTIQQELKKQIFSQTAFNNLSSR